MQAGSVAAGAMGVMLAIAVGTDVSAHRRDEYLQAARFAIAPGRVELQLDLTPGIAVAETIIAEIDRDGDGSFSAEETDAYARSVLSTIALDVDGQSLHLQLQPIASSLPTLEDFRRGEGAIQLQLDAVLPPLLEGSHRLAYRNTHHRDISAYLANALVPDSNRVAVKAQLRDVDQHDLRIDYVLRAGSETSSRDWLLGGGSGLALVIVLLVRYAERQASPMDDQQMP